MGDDVSFILSPSSPSPSQATLPKGARADGLIGLADMFSRPDVSVFKVMNFFEAKDPAKYLLMPTAFELIPDEDDDSARFYFIKALQVFADKTVPCYMSMDTDERISELVVKKTATGIVLEEMDGLEHSVIPAIASDRYGCNSELYYAGENPQIGLDILKSGIQKARNKDVVKEDIAMLKDEIRRRKYFFPSIETVKEALKIFINAAINQEYASLEDNVKLYEKTYDEMEAAIGYLRKMKSIDKLYPLLQHDNLYVKYYASVNLLKTLYYTEAIAALEKIRDAKGAFSVEAGFRVKFGNN